MDNEGKRLNKYIADAGYCSRRAADRLISEGKVQIQRRHRKHEAEHVPVIAGLGDKVFPGDTVIVEGRALAKKEVRKVYLMLNKPQGVVCTADETVENNVIDFMDLPMRVSYAGRLDKDSKGLLILTNDGDFINTMMKSSNYHEKEYICTVDREITDQFINKMGQGVKILLDDDAHKTKDHPDGIYVTTRKCRVKKISERKFAITLTQGYNRQIRRMCKAFGYGVSSLERVRILNLKLGDLRPGESRRLSLSEVKALKDKLYR